MDPTTFNMMRMMMCQMHMQHQQQQQQQQVTNRFLLMSQQMQMQMMQQLMRVQAPQALIASSPPQNGTEGLMSQPLRAIQDFPAGSTATIQPACARISQAVMPLPLRDIQDFPAGSTATIQPASVRICQPVMARPLLAIENVPQSNAVNEPLSDASSAGVNFVDTDNNVECSLPIAPLKDDSNISTANNPQIEDETNSSTTASLPNTASSSSNNDISVRAADAALKRKADSADDQPVQTRSKFRKTQM